MNKNFALICSLASLTAHLAHVRYCYCKAKVHSSSVSLMYVVHLRIIFSKAALQKRGSMEPMEPSLDPPLKCAHLSRKRSK